MTQRFETFIAGETIDLCVPTEEIARTSAWYSWFNDPALNKYLDQGDFPNTPEGQVAFLRDAVSGGTRLLLLIVTKTPTLKGVISLSSIDHKKRRAELALVVDSRVEPETSRLAALEAVARISEHGFERLKLDRIAAKQSRSLEKWQRRMELVGFRVEGVHKNDAYENRQSPTNAVSIACVYEDYHTIVKQRGALFDTAAAMQARVSALPERSIAAELEAFHAACEHDYYRRLWQAGGESE